jgi:hypothetical protein
VYQDSRIALFLVGNGKSSTSKGPEMSKYGNSLARSTIWRNDFAMLSLQEFVSDTLKKFRAKNSELVINTFEFSDLVSVKTTYCRLLLGKFSKLHVGEEKKV